MPRQRAHHRDCGVDALNILRVGYHHLDARRFELSDLILGLRHGAHEQHLRLERNDLLNVRLHAGLHGGDLQHLGRVVAVFAAADD
ncbi:hypothetical protein SDC9_117085 [bioreactor metagenome]|uniref:Uncharacterized protein n=1 Tax=bioreactor metagenome TaxID=1076179 RepID=A0A645BXT5_9ZZZZ